MAMEINGVTSQIMDLKTSTPGVTRKEEIKTGFKDVADYTKYLQGKYDYMNSGKTSMQGVPVTVSVSPAFLEKCKGDPEKAAFLEENLAVIPDCIKMGVNYFRNLGLVMTYESVMIDDNGNITMMGGCTNDPDGKIAKENAERKAEEERKERAKAEKRRAEEMAEEKRAEKRRAERKEAIEGTESRETTISLIGTDIREMTNQLIRNMNFGAEGDGGSVVSFDLKA